MKPRLDALLQNRIVKWVSWVQAHARAVTGTSLIITLFLGAYVALELGVNSDNMSLISDNLPSQQDSDRFKELFPSLDDALLVVIDGDTPELTRSATEDLERVLSRNRELFTEVYLPGGGDFFERNGLLYLSLDDLDVFADQMSRFQPLMAELEVDPSIANLAKLIEEGLEQAHEDKSGGEDEWVNVLDHVSEAVASIYEEGPLRVSWEEVLLRESPIETVTRRTIVVHPVLDPTQVFLAGAAMDEIRAAAARLDLDPEHGITVRITGNPAINYEEMLGILWDIATAGVFCFALVALVLTLALRSPRLVVSALVTLLSGLIWTAAFATAAFGEVNLISISFAILFIGLGVDFTIHLGMCYADLLRQGEAAEDALPASARSIGSSFVLCAVSTAIGFYAFVPTEYRGVAELGLIAGTGMFVILLMTLTLFPALSSSWLRVDPRSLRSELRFRTTWWRGSDRHPRLVRWVALVVALGAVSVLPYARFDPNVVAMRNPDTESVATFNDLLAERRDTMWFVNVVEPDLASAEATAERLRALAEVDRAITLADFVPDEQEEKLEILADVSFLLDVGAQPADARTRLPVERQKAALRRLHDFLAVAWADDRSLLAAGVVQLRERLGVFLDRIESEPDPHAALRGLEDALLGTFPAQLERLRASLAAEPIDRDSLPIWLVERLETRSGEARIQIFPSENLSEDGALHRFVEAVRSVAPKAVGIPVNLVEFGQVTVDSFRQALTSALLAIVALLWLLWRRAWDVALVMAPLLLAAALTAASVALLGIAFNFTNVIVIPLLLGIGVDSSIHLVHRAQQSETEKEDLLETTTARAVFYSALTTTVSFGSLALSSHLGMRSLGVLLTAGMIFTVICNLIVLPALIDLRRPRTR